jgi:hypothetical protein
MPIMPQTKKKVLCTLVASLLFATTAFAGSATSGIHVNGVELSAQQIAMLRQATGVSLPPGHYLVQNGCVSHLESGQVQCAPPQPRYGGGVDGYGGGSYGYGGGSGGYGYNNGSGGSWFQRGSDYSGGYSVGGDASGCIYTPDWSNC